MRNLQMMLLSTTTSSFVVLCWVHLLLYFAAADDSNAFQEMCRLTGSIYGNPGAIGTTVERWAPLVGVACANSGDEGSCYDDASVWSEVAINHGNNPVSSDDECSELCAETEGCDVWTFWPLGVGDTTGGPLCEPCPASEGGILHESKSFCYNGLDGTEFCGECPELHSFFVNYGVPDNFGFTCAQVLGFFKFANCCDYSEDVKASYKAPGACELYSAAPESNHVLDFVGGKAVTAPKNCNETKWLPFLEWTQTTKEENENYGNDTVYIDHEAEGFCDICPRQYGMVLHSDLRYCDGGSCALCGDTYKHYASGGSSDVSCEDTASWFRKVVGCCSLNITLNDANRSTPVDTIPRASNGRPCWVVDHSYGVARDGACADAEILAVFSTKDLIEIGTTQEWWTPRDTDASIELFWYTDHVFNLSDCLDACLQYDTCGGWQFIGGSCVLKAKLPCTPTIALSGSSNSIAGVSGCVDPSSNDEAEKSALSYSAYWFLDCDLPRCTAPYSRGTWKEDTFVPAFDQGNSCWYKQYTPSELYSDCAQDRWIVINGGSNALSFYTFLVNLFAPIQRNGSHRPLIGFNETEEYSIIDIVFKRGSMPILDAEDDGILFMNFKRFCDLDVTLPCEGSLSFQGDSVDWSPSYSTALKDALTAAPHEAGATRLTLIVSQVWSNAAVALSALADPGAANGWESAKTVYYGQSMIWYPCNVEKWCDFPELGATTDAMIQKFKSDLTKVMEVGNVTCATSRFDCFFASHGFGGLLFGNALKLIKVLEEMTAMYEWAHFIDYNAFIDAEEVVAGHLTPAMAFPALTMIWNTVCDGPDSGCPEAISISPSCWGNCLERGGEIVACRECTEWTCMNERQCDYQILDPVPWEIVITTPVFFNEEGVALNSAISSCFQSERIGTSFAPPSVSGSNYQNEACGRVWCGTVSSGWAIGIVLFVVGLFLVSPLPLTAFASGTKEGQKKDGSAATAQSLTASRENFNLLEVTTKNAESNGNDSDAPTGSDVEMVTEDSSCSIDEGASRVVLSNRKSEIMFNPVSVSDAVEENHEIEEGQASASESHGKNALGDEANRALSHKFERLESLGFARLLASQHIVLGHLQEKGAVSSVYFFGWGFTWVPWFFVLSGYVLTHARMNSSNPATVNGPFTHVFKRMATIFPTYALGVFLTMVVRVAKDVRLPDIDVLIGQSFLLQSWIPLWTENALLSQCWFLSNLLIYWAIFGGLFLKLRNLTLRWTCLLLIFVCTLPWLVVIVPTLFDSVDSTWYSSHQWGHTDSPGDIWTVMLKFHPFFYFHVFVFGMLLAVLRNHLKSGEASVLATAITNLTRFGATLGYLGLMLIFTVEEMKPMAHKLSTRLSVLLPLHGLMLLGLSPLPRMTSKGGLQDPIAWAFSHAPHWIGDFSYCQYVLQFIIYDLFPVRIINDPSFFLYLWGASLVVYKLVQKPGANLWRTFLPARESDAPVQRLSSLRRTGMLLIPPAGLAVILWVTKGIYRPTTTTRDSGLYNTTNITNVTRLSPFIRLAPEAVDLRLNWTVAHEINDKVEPLLINPTMLFRNDGVGGVEWIRAVRAHSVEQEISKTSYEGNTVTQHVLRFNSSILLSSEPFLGDLSAGFDGRGISEWGLDGTFPLRSINSQLISHRGQGAVWSDICEPMPTYNAAEKVLFRKVVSGPEDPKLLEVTWKNQAVREKPAWGVTFSSFPPAALLSESTNSTDCQWSQKATMQMYLAVNGPKLVAGEQAQGVRLRCGDPEGTEKNWIAFNHDGYLYYVYSVEPHVVVHVRTNDGACVEQYKTSSPELKVVAKKVYAIRGSATAIRYSKSEYLAVFHTYDPNRGYSTAAYTFQAAPPFAVLRVSKPLPLDGRAFVSSLAIHSDKVLVGYGDSDLEARVLVMSRNHLEDQFDWCSSDE